MALTSRELYEAPGPNESAGEPSILSQVRPARWSRADTSTYEAVRRLLDEALEECADHEAAALAAAVPDRREAARWRTVADELSAGRVRLRPDRRAAVRDVRHRCLAVLDQAVSFTPICAALAAGCAHALDPEAQYVRYEDAWWVRAGLGYLPAPPQLASVLGTYAQVLEAADAAVAAALPGRGA